MIDRIIRQKVNKDIEDLPNTISLVDLTDIYLWGLKHYPKTADYTFLLQVLVEFLPWYCGPRNNTLEKIWNIQNMFADHMELKYQNIEIKV